jgi:glucosamine--fructose-6-phosphate aminotransferase (isomerizing)
MGMDLSNNAYFQDIMAQPKAMRDTLEFLERHGEDIFAPRPLVMDDYRRIVLTGMGSSYHALAPLYYRLSAAGRMVQWIETSELIYYSAASLTRDTLVVAVSQSGGSAEVVHLLEQIGKCVDVVGVVNDPASVLAKQCTWPVLIQAGKEFSVSCKTYLSTLIALAWLGDQFLAPVSSAAGGHFEALRPCIPWAERYLADWQSHVAELETLYSGKTDLFFIGRGDSLAAVGTGGLTMKESTHFHAEGMSAAAFRHGPKEMLSAAMQTLVFEGPQATRTLNRQMAAELQQQGFPTELIAPDARLKALRLPEVDDRARHLVEMLPVQMTTLAIAHLRRHDPGVFSIGSKVTAVE